MSLNVSDDSYAYLQVEPTTGATFAEDDPDGLIQLNFDDTSGASGSGLNANADTGFGPEFTIANQGTDPVLVTIDPTPVDDELGGDGSLSFFAYSQEYDGKGATLKSTDQNSPGRSGVILESGTQVKVSGLFRDIDASDIDEDLSDASITIYAVSDNSELYPNGGPSDNRAGIRINSDGTVDNTG
ncbi:hypothetical protein PM076_16105 [Halorubrum ezzemoulense]|uniref:DUF1102 domain-containing protein n=1 Tax=Halorubrum ezzemoulense TaxID=337243 RepID=A0ABT4Z798_HALEZ|nr:hypothetical protein [Halorubrum ezzemoulense]MDB2246238.1 hypothetical protein [Halorubrum ezzemoulense]MDB2279823.1 hypothetical protein [Halorubrum ezzemoulense]MDB2290312.1 hypothetical protein [Halorubrum ezzemoulense]MDB2293598.1 hypothetical protein [Halorubrum ezzemoulense]MDB2297781.1 hypothetical protein [Halorubrum ezzemoulense]